jgi:ubiquitin-protein ligase
MTSILEKAIDKQIVSSNAEKNVITYNCKLPLFIKEIKYKDNKERQFILNRIKKIQKELNIKILDSFEQQEKIYILFYENKEIMDDLFDLPSNYEDINLEGYLEGHSAPIKKKEINTILSKEKSLCKIINENIKGTGFFCRMNIDEIPIKLALFTNNHLLDGNCIKTGKKIIIEHINFDKLKILDITKDRRTFTNEELDYTCIEIFENDNIFKHNELEELFMIDQNNLKEDVSHLLNKDILLLQYPMGNEFSFSVGKIDYIDNANIRHTASTNEGSSGSPLLKRNDYSIIGIHFGSKMKKKNKELAEYNASRNISAIIKDLKIRIGDKIRLGDKIIIDDKFRNEEKKREELLEEYKKVDKLGLIKYKSKNFILLNTIDFKCSFSFSDKFTNHAVSIMVKAIKKIDIKSQYEGFQIYGIIDNKVIGVIEGPPKTSFENGFFLFEMIVNNVSHLESDKERNKFYFKTKIFHPNFGTDGLLCKTDLPMPIDKTIIAVQSLLDDPNPDEWYNIVAAELYKKNRKEYEETVKRYTSQYASFINLQNELSKYNLNFKHIEEKK